MKNLNFIQSKAPSHHKKIKQWSLFWLLISVLTFLVIVYIQIQQCRTLLNVLDEKRVLATRITNFTSIMEQKQKLKQKETNLKNKIAFLTTQAKNNPKDFILDIYKIRSLHLESLTFGSDAVTINGTCSGTKQVEQSMQSLHEIPWLTTVQLEALNPEYHAGSLSFRCTFKGQLNA